MTNETTLAFQTDTKLAELWGAINAHDREAGVAIARLANLTRTKDDYKAGGKDKRTATEVVAAAVALTSADAFAAARADAPANTPDSVVARSLSNKEPVVARHLAALDAARQSIAELHAKAAPLEDVYAEHHWSRFFIVTSSQGHVHSSRHCSTCYDTTEYGWLPNLSGLTEADAVEQEGSILCSVCFPTAPTEWTTGISKAQAEKEAAKCSGSGKFVSSNGRRYVRCPDCAAMPARTSTGKLRAHKPVSA